MNISSKLKKIISFMLVAVLVMSAVVLPVSAAEATTEEAEKPEVQFDFSRGYYTDSADLKYTGELSNNLTSKFNVRQEYDMSFTMNDYYYSAPFCFYVGDGTDPIQMFTGDNQKYGEGFSYSYLQSATATFFKENELSLSDYDVYYYGVVGRSSGKGVFSLNYLLIPRGKRIAFCNSSYKNEFDNGSSVWGFYAKGSSFASRNGNDKNNSIVHVRRYMDASYGKIQDSCNWAEYSSNCVYDGALYYPINCDKGFYGTQYACMNIPVFNTIEDTGLYVNGIRDPIPDNKAPAEETEPDVNDGDKLSADSFGWDSFKCQLSQAGDKYQFVYNYTYSNADMKKNPNKYMLDIKYSQSCKYQVVGGYGSAYKDHNSSMNSRHVLDAGGVLIETDNILQTPVYNNGDDDTTDRSYLRYNLYNFFTGSDEIAGSAKIYSSYIYVTVVLKHARFDPASRNDSTNLFDISSDVRTFKFDALTLEKIDNPEEITSDVTTKDITDSSGNIVGKEVSSIVTNDNSTHTTINNYYYDSDGKQSASGSGLGESLSEIASGLISFIKTLVTEGLPAALEILKSLIKTISDLFGFIGDQIGDIGQGTQNGIIAVLKAIPVPLWGICSVALLVFVIVGVLKHFF